MEEREITFKNKKNNKTVKVNKSAATIFKEFLKGENESCKKDFDRKVNPLLHEFV